MPNRANRKERREDRVIDLRQLREIVQRDLAWLLNTNDNATSGSTRSAIPTPARSVLNFGIHEVAGEFSTPSGPR
jgi:type VI secretion system protein ImpF